MKQIIKSMSGSLWNLWNIGNVKVTRKSNEVSIIYLKIDKKKKRKKRYLRNYEKINDHKINENDLNKLFNDLGYF